MNNSTRISAKTRVETIFDRNSVFYLESKLNKNGGGVLIGYGTISRRLGFFFSQDYSVQGGALTSINAKKISHIYDLAAENGAPIIGIYDSCGAVIDDGFDILSSYGDILSKAAKYSGVIPQISIVAGPSTGMMSICSGISDFTIVTKSFGEMYINSPKLLTKEEETYIDIEDYGVACKLSQNGSAAIIAEDDLDAANIVKKIFSFIPSNNMEYAEKDSKAEYKKLDKIGNMDEIVKNLSSDELELNKEMENEIKTSLAIINGRTIGIIGVGRSKEVYLDSGKINKMTQMAKLCDCYNIPILTLVNSSGFVKGLEDEKRGLIISGAKLSIAFAGCSVPKVALVTGKAIGASFTLLADKKMGFDFSYGAEDSEISIAPAEELIKVIYKEELKDGDDYAKTLEDLMKSHKDELSSAFKAAEKGLIDEVVDLDHINEVISASFEVLSTKRTVVYPKKHSSILV